MCGKCKQRVCSCTIVYKNTTTQAINREAVFQSLKAGDNINLDYNINNGTTLISAVVSDSNPLTFDNGLTLTGNDVQLGGSISNYFTTINLTDAATRFTIGDDFFNPSGKPFPFLLLISDPINQVDISAQFGINTIVGTSTINASPEILQLYVSDPSFSMTSICS